MPEVSGEDKKCAHTECGKLIPDLPNSSESPYCHSLCQWLHQAIWTPCDAGPQQEQAA
jgi:hypothetical protein